MTLSDIVTDKKPVLPISMRACVSTYVVWGVVLGPMLVFATYDTARQGLWHYSIVFGGCLTLLVAWLVAFRIVLTEEGVRSLTLFSRPALLPYRQIRQARIERSSWPIPKPEDRNKGPYRLVLLPTDRRLSKLEINIKPFSRRDLTLLMHVLTTRAVSAEFDKSCLRMLEGKMPSLFFESQ